MAKQTKNQLSEEDALAISYVVNGTYSGGKDKKTCEYGIIYLPKSLIGKRIKIRLADEPIKEDDSHEHMHE